MFRSSPLRFCRAMFARPLVSTLASTSAAAAKTAKRPAPKPEPTWGRERRASASNSVRHYRKTTYSVMHPDGGPSHTPNRARAQSPNLASL